VELATTANQYLVQIVAGLASGAVLFLIASGLTLIFGALRVVNFAHGSLFLLGAYVAFEIGSAIGVGNGAFWAVLLLSGLAVALMGIAVEITLFRPIYRRPLLTQLLVTFALVLIIAGVVRKVWGAQGESTTGPPFLAGGVEMFGSQIPKYQFFFMGAALVVAAALWLLLYRTELGRMIRAAVSDNELLGLTGVNVRLLYTGVFALGCFFAGLAGALVTLQGAIGPGLAVDSIIKAFVVIVLGGLGSLSGAFIASFLVGVAEAVGVPEVIVRKKPSADLWVGQTDEGELGFSYREVDKLLYFMVDERYSRPELTAAGFPERFIDDVTLRIMNSQFKRRLPVIAKISQRTIDRDFRYARDWGR